MSENIKTRHIITLSQTALIGLVLNGLEAYTIEHKNIIKGKKKGLETFGSLFGHQADLKDGTKIYHIEFINTDTSSGQTTTAVDYNQEAIQLKNDTVKSFWPRYNYIGDFHTHPYGHYKDVIKVDGYYFSDEDRSDLQDNSEFWISLGHTVSLLLTIGHMERAGWRETQWVNSSCNCVEFTLGNFRLWLTAYISCKNNEKLSYSADNNCDVMLDCPSLTGLVWEQNKYGRYKIKTKTYNTTS